MNIYIKTFGNSQSAKRYFNQIKKNSGILYKNKNYTDYKFANFTLENNNIIAKSTYHSDNTLKNMTESKLINW